MYAVLLMCFVGVTLSQTILPHGQQLHELVDNNFGVLDRRPKDGVILEPEWDIYIELTDANHDKCVSYHEYLRANEHNPLEVTHKLFYHFDHDNDNCLELYDLSEEFHLADLNHDNQLSLNEFDQYYTQMLTQLFGLD